VERFQFLIHQFQQPSQTAAMDSNATGILHLPPHFPRHMVEAFLRSFLLKIDMLKPLPESKCPTFEVVTQLNMPVHGKVSHDILEVTCPL
jgi:hypothetical protein